MSSESEFPAIRRELGVLLAEIRRDLTVIKWMLAAALAMLTAILCKVFV